MAGKKSARHTRRASPANPTAVPQKQSDLSSASDPDYDDGASSSSDQSSSSDSDSDILPAPGQPTSTHGDAGASHLRHSQGAGFPTSPSASSETPEASSRPSPASVPASAPEAETAAAPTGFDEWYLRELTREFGDDLDKIRSAPDFTADSLAVLIETLKQCSGSYSREQRRKVMDRVEALAEMEVEEGNGEKDGT